MCDWNLNCKIENQMLCSKCVKNIFKDPLEKTRSWLCVTVCKCNNESHYNSECRVPHDERDAAKARLKRRMRRMDESSLGTAG